MNLVRKQRINAVVMQIELLPAFGDDIETGEPVAEVLVSEYPLGCVHVDRSSIGSRGIDHVVVEEPHLIRPQEVAVERQHFGLRRAQSRRAFRHFERALPAPAISSGSAWP